MVETKRTCPECNLIFQTALAETGLLTCPLCDTVFAVRPPAEIVPFALARMPVAAPPPPSPGASAQQVWKGCLAVCSLLFLVGAVVYAYRLVEGIGPQAVHTPPVMGQPFTEPTATLEIKTAHPEPSPLQAIPHPLQPTPLSIRPRPSLRLAEARPPLALSERVNRAIDRGIEHLRKHHNGHDQYQNYLGLLGLTLLECGTPVNDPSVRQIAAWLRTREQDLTATYELSLAILFLDGLNDPRDRALIRTFGQRLLAGQQEGGTWTYSCLANPKRRPPEALLMPQIPQIVSWSNADPRRNSKARIQVVFRGDNSNTQFGILGLWVAQRHGVSARQALLTTEQYFRQTQASDGSWSYHPLHPHYRDSMTCAGLMSLAMRYGAINGQGRDIRPDHPVHVSDRVINQGLRFLDKSIDKVALTGGRITGVEARDPLYFLWSLERMAVIYDLKTIGNKEWYPWAAEMLVEIQNVDGSWHTPYPSPVGTCFALLILKRSNVAHDLQLTVGSETPRRDSGLGGLTTTPRRPNSMSGIVGGTGSSSSLGATSIQETKSNPSSKKVGQSLGVLEMPSKK